ATLAKSPCRGEDPRTNPRLQEPPSSRRDISPEIGNQRYITAPRAGASLYTSFFMVIVRDNREFPFRDQGPRTHESATTLAHSVRRRSVACQRCRRLALNSIFFVGAPREVDATRCQLRFGEVDRFLTVLSGFDRDHL